jgi:valyl-tRNA synthetase
MKNELSSRYLPSEVEKGRYESWISHNCFTSGDDSKPPFCIVIPPPNVTGKLHLGHAWDGTLQDMIIRYKRLKGYDALWLPGMDHAGIATQAKVEEKLRAQGISRHTIGREAFLEYAWAWKNEYASHIHDQWKMMGLALDYSKERFTLDDGLSQAVREVFVRLYEKGLIYRGKRIINWDPKLQTALSNIEVIYKETESYLYYFKYFEIDGPNYLLVATTRPETMFGDVCIVVNPNDPRYQNWIGKEVINPANLKTIPVISDDYVDLEFGTGAMKCTPAHDPNDFLIGEKYGLDKPICMNPDGTMNELAGSYQGLDRFECRSKLVTELTINEKMEKRELRVNQVGYSERSDVIVEPYLSNQWFVKMKPLAEQALSYQQGDNKVDFFPERFEKIFTNWMSGIEDWCISRQLWWGHRIPAWYDKQTGEVVVSRTAPADANRYQQDEDVLDTWFSSALWPFSTLGWPEETNDLKRYYPTNVLVTAYDIIFFWVSRMIFQALEFTGAKPFHHALIHGLIRDSQGRKMSKSLGNGVDPADVIQRYGTDALRFFLTTNSAPGLDLRYQEEKVEASWNFINKLWNAARFVLLNLPENFQPEEMNLLSLNATDQWILNRLNQTIASIDQNMDRYEFVMAGTFLYDFIWDDFCSWYIEMSKISLNDDNTDTQNATQQVLFFVLEAILKLIHPFMPFVSESIYQTMHGDDSRFLIQSTWPKPYLSLDNNSIQAFEAAIEIIKTIRTMRNENNLAPNRPIRIHLVAKSLIRLSQLELILPYIKRFGFVEEAILESKLSSSEKGMSYALNEMELYVPFAGILNIEEETIRLQHEIERLHKEIERCESMLANPNFLSKAPEAKIDNEKSKMKDYKNRLHVIIQRLSQL